MTRPPRRRLRIVRPAILTAVALTAIGVGAPAPAGAQLVRDGAATTAVRLLPPRLRAAAARSRAAEHAFVVAARSLHRCLSENPSSSSSCASLRSRLQVDGSRLGRAQAELSWLARATSGPAARARSADFRAAPRMTVLGDALTWTRVAPGMNTYLLMSSVPGQRARVALVRGRTATPPPIPGATVRYTVRTTAPGSTWASDVAISYPPAPASVEAPDTRTAPALTVIGRTLTWVAVAHVQTYVLLTEVPGVGDRYSDVSGTSATPPPVPGSSVSYSIRTAVEGSAWAPTVTISYPYSSQTPVQVPSAPPEELAQAPTALQTGLNSGEDQSDYAAATTLGAKLVRLSFNIDESAAQLEPAIAHYAAEGVRVLPLACFDGRIPTSAEAANLANWAAAFGSGGTFWAGRSDGSLAVQSIEFGNETSYSYQYSEDSQSAYAARARSYAERFAESATAIRVANPAVGLLAQGDSGNAGPTWIENMFAAVPDLGQLVAGWTIHPYGPDWRPRIEAMIRETAAEGAPATIPVDVTEFGLSTDNGQCVTENYGYPTCMTYAEAGAVLTQTVGELHRVLDGRPGMFLVYTDKDWDAVGESDDREAYFGALGNLLATKGAYTTAVESILADGS